MSQSIWKLFLDTTIVSPNSMIIPAQCCFRCKTETNVHFLKSPKCVCNRGGRAGQHVMCSRNFYAGCSSPSFVRGVLRTGISPLPYAKLYARFCRLGWRRGRIFSCDPLATLSGQFWSILVIDFRYCEVAKGAACVNIFKAKMMSDAPLSHPDTNFENAVSRGTHRLVPLKDSSSHWWRPRIHWASSALTKSPAEPTHILGEGCLKQIW